MGLFQWNVLQRRENYAKARERERCTANDLLPPERRPMAARCAELAERFNGRQCENPTSRQSTDRLQRSQRWCVQMRKKKYQKNPYFSIDATFPHMKIEILHLLLDFSFTGKWWNINFHNKGTTLPQLTSRIVNIETSAKFVLVVEKDTVFQKILQFGIIERFNGDCIVLTVRLSNLIFIGESG